MGKSKSSASFAKLRIWRYAQSSKLIVFRCREIGSSKDWFAIEYRIPESVWYCNYCDVSRAAWFFPAPACGHIAEAIKRHGKFPAIKGDVLVDTSDQELRDDPEGMVLAPKFMKPDPNKVLAGTFSMTRLDPSTESAVDYWIRYIEGPRAFLLRYWLIRRYWECTGCTATFDCPSGEGMKCQHIERAIEEFGISPRGDLGNTNPVGPTVIPLNGSDIEAAYDARFADKLNQYQFALSTRLAEPLPYDYAKESLLASQQQNPKLSIKTDPEPASEFGKRKIRE